MAILKLYNTDLDPSRNMVVEDIETYLTGIGAIYTDNDFQLIKPALEQTIKINLPENAAIENANLIRSANFASITNIANTGASVTYYYYIMGAQ